MIQLLREIKTKKIDYGSSYQEPSNLLTVSGKSVINNPRFINSGSIILGKEDIGYQTIKTSAVTYAEVISDKLMYVKLILDVTFDLTDDDAMAAAFTLQTSHFSYNNPKFPIIIALIISAFTQQCVSNNSVNSGEA